MTRTMIHLRRHPAILSLALAALLAMPALARAQGDALVTTLRLAPAAQVAGPQVRLADIARAEGPLAPRLDNLVVANLAGDTAAVRMSDVETLLNNQHINLALVSLRGFAVCRVRRLAPVAATADPAQPAANIAVSPASDSTPDALPAPAAAGTLRQTVLDYIAELAQTPLDQLQIQFARGDEQALDASLGTDRIEFEPLASALPGRLPLVLRRHGKDPAPQTLRLTASVSRRYLAVVTTRSVARGQIFAPGDVTLREVLIDHAQAQPLTRLEDVVGQASGTLLRPGAIVLASDAQPPLLVRNGEILRVQTIVGGLVIRTVARARQDGALGQTIPVINENSRKVFNVKVTALHEAVAETIATPTRAE